MGKFNTNCKIVSIIIVIIFLIFSLLKSDFHFLHNVKYKLQSSSTGNSIETKKSSSTIFAKSNFTNYSEISQVVKEIYRPLFNDSRSHLCPEKGRHLKLVVIIHTAPDHFQHRTRIRDTWGHFKSLPNISVAFLIGKSDDDLIENGLLFENEIYNDIIRSDLVESYKYLTLKSISMLEWMSKKCHHAKFLLKIDDDVFLNVPKALHLVEEKMTETRKIYGYLVKDSGPSRSNDSKYFVSVPEYKLKKFPTYVLGAVYLIKSDVTYEIFKKSLETQFFKLEDVFITGLVASQQLGIELVKSDFFFMDTDPSDDESWYDMDLWMSFHLYENWKMYRLWEIATGNNSVNEELKKFFEE